MSILKDYFDGKNIDDKNYFAIKNPSSKDIGLNIGLIQNNNVKNRDFNRALLGFNLRIFEQGTRLGKPKTAEELHDRICDYFIQSFEAGWTPTWEGVGVATNYSNRGLWEIENGFSRPDFQPVLKEAKQYLAMFDSQAVIAGEIPASVYQFRSKNFYGMRDIQEIKPVLTNELSNEEAQQIIARLPEV